MIDQETTAADDTRLRLTAATYYAVLLAAFVVGIYGFFSLLWLAGEAAQRASYTFPIFG
ncbi:MAG TPA: hypothetical protein VJH03_20210 [Blastocatellia bacterium]|nr:hypothetical protein [Blastocatellia bacterium]